MREQIQLLEKEYNCTVIYLGTEVLLDNNYGIGSAPLILGKQKVLTANLEKGFYETYKKVLEDSCYFATKATSQEKRKLYGYIRSEIKTWFGVKKVGEDWKTEVDPKFSKGHSKIMFLAGRAVVQLKRKDIEGLFN